MSAGGDVLVGIDLGTTVCKAAVADARQGILGEGAATLSLSVRPGGVVEQDAEQWWGAVRESLASALAQSGAAADRVRAIGISTQGLSIVPVDGRARPLRPALSWMDVRAGEQMERARAALGEQRLFSLTGKRCSPAYSLAKLLWLREHEPRVYDRAAKILLPHDFLLARMTGEFLTDHTLASGTMLHDVRACSWSGEILRELELSPEKLPALRRSGEAAGRLTAEAAAALGLPRSTVVAVGGQDQKVAAFGAGLAVRRATIALGTALAVERQAPGPMLDPQMRVPCFADLARDRWVLEGYADCCSVLDWLKAVAYPGTTYEEINAEVERAEGGSGRVLVLPFFSGTGTPYRRGSARGSIHGLDFAADRAGLVRGFYEGVACAVRANLEVMEDLAGPLDALCIFGGGSRSVPWCRIIADVTGRAVHVLTTSEAAAAGALVLAGRCCGAICADAMPAWAPAVRATFEPRAACAQRAAETWREFCRTRDGLSAAEDTTGGGQDRGGRS